MFEIRYSSHSSCKNPAIQLTRLLSRPNVDFVVFRGDAEETSPYHFKGHVIIMTSETIQNKGVKIALKGKRRTAFVKP